MTALAAGGDVGLPSPAPAELSPAPADRTPTVTELIDALDTADSDTRSLWQGLGRAGVPRLLLRDSAESLWIDPARLSELLVALDARLAPGAVLSVCVQVATVIPLLRNCAAVSPLAGRVLEQLLRGDAIVALAATDAGLSGSALLDIRTTATLTPDGVTLNGGKEWISNAGQCDEVLVLARCRPARHFTSYCWVLAPADDPGVSFQPAADTLLAGAGLGHLRFDDVRLGPKRVIGAPGRALAELARQLGAERLASALWARALCRRVLADTHRYLLARPAGEGTSWDNAAVRERFARCLVELCQLDSMCAVSAARAITAARGMALKASCAVIADRILGECLDLRGADSYRDDGLTRTREQFAMFAIAGGATGAMLAGIADHADELLRAVG